MLLCINLQKNPKCLLKSIFIICRHIFSGLGEFIQSSSHSDTQFCFVLKEFQDSWSLSFAERAKVIYYIKESPVLCLSLLVTNRCVSAGL